ncbi:MAG: RNA 2',3'-cyclic phosphodiesterase [Gemmatimonadetes bacterium]|nr:RNA 2',3'-cyclic phosphodiesterase [Gemmatimonadota bacterium]
MRLFVAINLPDGVRHAIRTATARLREAGFPVRWVDEQGLHLTLRFLGEVAESRRDEIVAAVGRGAAGAKPFVLTITGFGVFPSVERPRVIWVGCEGVPPLELLQHHVELEMERCGFPVEGRPFRPHLTLGRSQKDAAPSHFRELEAVLDGLSFEGEALVESIELMESRLGNGGSAYRPVHSVAFDT